MRKWIWLGSRNQLDKIERLISLQDAMLRTNALAKRAVEFTKGPRVEQADELELALSRPLEDRDIRLSSQ